jgi:hypothetical protein
MKRSSTHVSLALTLLPLGALALAPRPLQADVPGYTIQRLVKIGDTIGDLKISGQFQVGSLNDRGDLSFTTGNAAGGEILFQYRDGTFTPIVAGGRDAPGGKWPRNVGIRLQVGMNQEGDIAFAAGTSKLNTYRWDAQAGQVSIVAAAGMPAVNDLTFKTGSDPSTPAMNDYGEVAFQATVVDSAGKTQRGIFFLGRDGKLASVLLPGQAVAGAGTVGPSPNESWISLNNAGVVGFQARRAGDKSDSIFTWENGTITPVLLVAAAAPQGGTFAQVSSGQVNNKNRNVTVVGALAGSAQGGSYLRIGDQWIATGVPGQEMPGGGKYIDLGSYSYTSRTGDNAFTTALKGGDAGIYRIDADGNLSLIVKSSVLGAKLASDSWFITINGKGEIALPVRFTGDRVDTLILLKPVSPQ